MLPRTPRNRCFNASRKKSKEKQAKTEDFRRKLEPVSSSRRFANASNEQKRAKISKESVNANAPRPIREKSPNRTRRGTISADKVQDKDKESGKCTDNKRKRKKISSRSQSSSENALVPSKLISLSLSLLLAALLQAVRCLTDLVEDAFRSVNCDRSGLLQ